MVIFNSYVKLPEGIPPLFHPFFKDGVEDDRSIDLAFNKHLGGRLPMFRHGLFLCGFSEFEKTDLTISGPNPI